MELTQMATTSQYRSETLFCVSQLDLMNKKKHTARALMQREQRDKVMKK